MTPLLIIGVLIAIIVMIYWCSSKETLAFQKSLYYQVIDENGTESTVHDSGKDPTLQNLRLQILKREINDRNATVLVNPRQLRMGCHPEKLSDTFYVHPDDIEDHEDYYVVSIARGETE